MDLADCEILTIVVRYCFSKRRQVLKPITEPYFSDALVAKTQLDIGR